MVAILPVMDRIGRSGNQMEEIMQSGIPAKHESFRHGSFRHLGTAVAAVTLIGASLALGACGESKGDRALSGGAIGAGAGAVGGALVGAPVSGAVIGGAAGAATGAMTDKDQIDLGKPAWK